MSKYHPLVQKIIELLTTNQMWFETFEHSAVRTSEEAASVRTGYTLAQGAKALLVRIKGLDNSKYFLQVVVPGDQKFDVVKVKTYLQAKDVRFATEDEVKELTGGVEPGGVPPFGNLFHLRVIVDPQLLANEKIIFNAGDRSFSVAMLSTDYSRIVHPEVAPVI